MKKIFASLLFLVIVSSVFAVSYKNNTYQKLANEYTKKAEIALNAGHYDDAVEYSRKAEENAALSKAYIETMIARTDAEEILNVARAQIAWAEEIDAPNTFPMAYTAAKESYNNAEAAFATENYSKVEGYANATLAALKGVEEITPLPEYYIVRPWADTKDCFWNIAKRPYIYNNPLLWENLYQSNKEDLEKPLDPNLIHPSMKMEIPSIAGEYRAGTYDPRKEYNNFGE